MVSFSEASGQALVFSEAFGQVLIIFRGICSSIGHFQKHLFKRWSFSEASGQALVMFTGTWSSTGHFQRHLVNHWSSSDQFTNRLGAKERQPTCTDYGDEQSRGKGVWIQQHPHNLQVMNWVGSPPTQLTGHKLGGESTHTTYRS